MASLYIRYEDIRTVMDESSSRFSQWQEVMEDCQKNMEELTQMDQFSGAAADSIRCYLQEVHGMLMTMIASVFQDFSSRFILYRDGYYDIDGNKNTVLSQETLEKGMEKYKKMKSQWETFSDGVVSTVNSVSDIAYVPCPRGETVINAIGKIYEKLDELNQEALDFESSTLNGDVSQARALIASVQALIMDYGSGAAGPADAYESGDYLKSDAFKDAAVNVMASQDYLEQNQDRIQAAYDDEMRVREEIQKEYEEQLAKERAEGGFWQVVGAIGLAVVGTVAIVASAGAATPLVAGVAFASGVGTCIFAGAEAFEGGQHIGYGLAGDPYTSAWNPVRDTVFMGNQEAYNFTKEVFSTTAGLSITAAKAGQAAVAMRRSKYYGTGIKGACSGEILRHEALKEGTKAAAKDFIKDKTIDAAMDHVVNPVIDDVGDDLGMSETGKQIIKTGAKMAVDKGADKVTGEYFKYPDGYEDYKNIARIKKINKEYKPYEDALKIKGDIGKASDILSAELKDEYARDGLSIGGGVEKKSQDYASDYEEWKKQQEKLLGL